jgi:hypothetical protein
VHTVCTAVNTFETKIEAQAKALQGAAGSDQRKPAALKSATSSVLGEAKADSEAAASTIEQAGTPKVANGKTVRSTLVGAFRKLSSGYADDRAKVNALDPGDPATFGSKLNAIGNDVQQLGGSIGKNLEGQHGLGDKALETAGNKDVACTSLQ